MFDLKFKNLFLTLILVNFFPLSVYSEIRIKLQPQVEIRGRVIYLGDIAEIDASTELKQKLQAIELGSTNKTGRARTITIPHVKARILKHGLSHSDLSFDGMVSSVTSKIMTVSAEDIYSQAENFFRQNLFFGKNDFTQLEIRPLQQIEPIRVDDVDSELKFVPIGDLSRGCLEAQVISNGIVKKRVSLTFEITVSQPVVVAKCNIPKGIGIRADFLSIEHREIKNPANVLLTRINQVQGKIASGLISKGKIISRSDFKKDFIVSKGSIVVIIVQKGNLKIQAHGKALEDGTLGQLIRVISLNSNKERIGEVAGRNQIRIHF